ncbi:MAG TPA: chloride channel protein [Kofleriaceae bacterium]|jgi:CIC family chloride channel protein
MPDSSLIIRARAWSQELLLRFSKRFSLSERQRLFGLTVAIGGACGLVAVAFHLTIHWMETHTIERALDMDTWQMIPIALGITIAGALVSGVILVRFPGARGSGIPQIKIAYVATSMKLRARDSIAKFFIGALQIGTGSSLGREGPTAQICAGVAKAMGRLAGVSARNVQLLLPVGVAAGIAAAFNAPIAAVTFTIEEVVGSLDQTLLSGVIVAAAFAAIVERSILGENPVLSIPSGFGLDHPSSLIVYVALGVVAAFVSIAFTDGLLILRLKFRASRIPLWMQPAVGACVTGAIAVAIVMWHHVDGITGGGYPALIDSLHGELGLETLAVLCVCKLIATVFSYSSGGAGGIFAPSLVMGAMLGGAFGYIDVHMFGHGANEMGAFALVGMGAVFAGVIRAPITSVMIILEMTGGYGLTLPLMITNMMAYGIARHFRPHQIYEALMAQDAPPPAPPSAPVLDVVE